MRKDDDEEDERKEVRRAEEEEKGTAIFLNIEGGESNAAAFERGWEAAPSCFKCGFPKEATFSAAAYLPAMDNHIKRGRNGLPELYDQPSRANITNLNLIVLRVDCRCYGLRSVTGWAGPMSRRQVASSSP